MEKSHLSFVECVMQKAQFRNKASIQDSDKSPLHVSFIWSFSLIVHVLWKSQKIYKNKPKTIEDL